MKNLENYGVLEMNAKEISDANGGWDATEAGMIAGYVFGRLLKNAVEGYLPW